MGSTIDCPNNEDGNFYSCYGQNIGAGYLATQMGQIMTEGFYNPEAPQYTYYGREPTDQELEATLHAWGHFSQMVWVGTATVGCYTTDCSNYPGQLGKINNPLIRPIFTVCNYGPPGKSSLVPFRPLLTGL